MPLIIIFSAAVLIALILYQKIFIIVTYKDEFNIYVKFLFVKIDITKDKGGKEKDEAPKPKKKDKSDDFFDKITDMFDLFKSMKIHLREKATCEECSLYLAAGTGDAASTAIMIGFLWGSVYNLIALSRKYVEYKKGLRDVKINLVPVYSGERFLIDFKSIFSVRAAHIMVIGFILIKSVISLKLKNKQKAV